MRIVRESSFRYGLNYLAIEARDEAVLDRLIDKLNARGWKLEWTTMVEDCDYGWVTSYAVRSDVRADFSADFKQAKAELVAELKAERQALTTESMR